MRQPRLPRITVELDRGAASGQNNVQPRPGVVQRRCPGKEMAAAIDRGGMTTGGTTAGDAIRFIRGSRKNDILD